MPLQKEGLESMSARLQDMRQSLLSLQEEIRRSTPLVREAEEETGAGVTGPLESFTSAVNDLLKAEDALSSRLRVLLALGGDLGAVIRQLESLRERNRVYRESFDELWRASLPVQVEAHLRNRRLTVEAVWEKRWGSRAAERARAVVLVPESADMQRLGSRIVRDDALLTLRYADLSFAEVAKTLDVTPPFVLARMADLETEITERFFSESVRAQARTAEAPEIGIQKATPSAAGPALRPTRYSRLLEVSWDGEKRPDGRAWSVLLSVLTPDDGGSLPDGLVHPKLKADVLSFYLLGEDVLRHIPYRRFVEIAAEEGMDRERVQEEGSEDFWESVAAGTGLGDKPVVGEADS